MSGSITNNAVGAISPISHSRRFLSRQTSGSESRLSCGSNVVICQTSL